MSSKCKVCGRKLRLRSSRAAGAGRTCLRKFVGLMARQNLERAGQVSMFETIDVGGPRETSET